MAHRPFLLSALVVLSACSSARKTDGATAEGTDAGLVASEMLTLSPANVTLFIDTSKTPRPPAIEHFAAEIEGVDVTGETTFTLDDAALGAFSGSTLTTTTSLGAAHGVTTTVRATARGRTGEAKVTIVELRRSPDATGHRDFFFTMPYRKPPTPAKDTLMFSTELKKVDVVFVEDTTGSMSGEMDAINRELTKTIAPALVAAIPSVGIAVVGHDDYPVFHHGRPGYDLPVYLMQTVTTDVSAAQIALNHLKLHDGADFPESQIAAQYWALTGNELTWPGGKLPAHHPPKGTFGGVDLREGALPVVVEITDAPWHNGVDPTNDYEFPAPKLADLTKAYADAHAKFVGILADLGPESNPVPDADALSDATGSSVVPEAFGGKCGVGLCCTGLDGKGIAPDAPGGKCRLDFRARDDGSGVANGIVAAISAISVGAIYDISYTLANDPSNVAEDGTPVDATKFIAQLRAMKEGSPGDGCLPHATKKLDPSHAEDDTFAEVTVGSSICFEVMPAENDSVAEGRAAQFFSAQIAMVGEPGRVDLGDQRAVLFLVPPKGPVVR